MTNQERTPFPQVNQHLVALTGIDGSGKTTLIDALMSDLEPAGWARLPKFDSYLPGSLSALLGDGLPEEVVPREVMTGKRAVLYRVAQVMEFGTHVVSKRTRDVLSSHGVGILADRWALDWLAWARTAPTHPWTEEIIEAVPVPDLTILLDVPAEVAVARIAARGRPHALDTYEVLQPYREAILSAAGMYRGRVEIIDGTSPPAELLVSAHALLVTAVGNRAAPVPRGVSDREPSAPDNGYV